MNPTDSTPAAASVSADPVRTRPALVHHDTRLTWRRMIARLLRQEWVAASAFVVFDVATWLLLCNLFGFLRHDRVRHVASLSAETQLLALFVILVTLFVIGGYDRRSDMTSLGYTSEHIIAMITALVLSSLLIYSVSTYSLTLHPSRAVMLASFALFTPVSLGYRRFVHQGIAVNRSRRVFLVLGAGEIAQRFYTAYQGSVSPERLRFFDVTGGGAGQALSGEGSPVVEGEAVARLDQPGAEVSGVIIAEETRRIQPEIMDRLVRMHFQRMPVYTLESFYETQWRRVPARNIDPSWPLQIGFQLTGDSVYAHLKRLFDVVVSATALLVLSPLLLVLMVMTWLDSGRPALFRQPRVGRDNRPFTILKFRTMFNSPPPTRTEDLYTKVGDARITRLGHWLRKLRLDELPQLFNVLKGDMSLIGPRAEWTKCAERYEHAIPYYHFRHLVKPGITGWAQVNYPYGSNEEDALQKLKYDLYYIRYYSLRLDAMIVLKTLHIMVWGKGQ